MTDGLSIPDINRFVNALNFVEDVTGRSAIDSLNRAGLHAIIGSGSYPGAMQLTPKADKGKINAVTKAQLTGFVIKRARRKGTWPLTTEQIKQEVAKERKRRIAAVGYAAFVGWSKAAQAMGGTGVARRYIQAGANKYSAAGGRGQKANKATLMAIIVNTAAAIERIGLPGLQGGLNNAARDLEDYGNRKLQEQYDKVKP